MPRRAGAPVPVWHLDYSYDFPARPVFASIGDMVSFWIELVDNGHISWDVNGEWHIHEPVSDAIQQRIRGVPPVKYADGRLGRESRFCGSARALVDDIRLRPMGLCRRS